MFYRQLAHRWQVWILPVSGICLVIAGLAVLGVDSGNDVAWVVMLTLGPVLLLIFGVTVPLTPKRIWKRLEPQFVVRTLEFSDLGIKRLTALSDGTMRWAMFKETVQRDDLYLLQIGDGPGYFIVPRRAFMSRSDEEAFRQLVERFTAAHLDPIGS